MARPRLLLLGSNFPPEGFLFYPQTSSKIDQNLVMEAKKTYFMTLYLAISSAVYPI
jgi:hypothetical protein